jgi:hypothetical protein
LVIVVLALAASGSGLVGAVGDGSAASGQTTRLGLWVGTVHVRQTRSTKFVNTSATGKGDFWFRVDGVGRVHGFANVAYEPTFDPDGINAFLDDVKTSAGSAVSVAGFGAIGGAVVGEFVGVKADFDEPLAVRSGPLSGTLVDNTLSLRWSSGKLGGIPVRIPLLLVHGQQRLSRQTLALPWPWPAAASVSDDGGEPQVVSDAKPQTSGRRSARTVTDAYWSAYRVGG